ncbi:cholinesterase-like, partial [Oppia nitens]|uniref:cholinesterase-like n=1 Tax=Oppia nitens TaxID=1686743 RepID=UPI0023DB4E36
MNNIEESEDCLTLIVWAPVVDGGTGSSNSTNTNNTNNQLKPVLFYIHGGALSLSSAYDPMANMSMLATYGLVVVSVNYRLGQLGFLYGGSNSSAPGNVGFYDQLLALHWVRDNIHLFGGNKNMITLMGISAGSWSVTAHILSPLSSTTTSSRALFSRAIIQSGAELFNKDRPVVNRVDGLEKARQLARKVGCNPDANDKHWLDCMRRINDLD